MFVEGEPTGKYFSTFLAPLLRFLVPLLAHQATLARWAPAARAGKALGWVEGLAVTLVYVLSLQPPVLTEDLVTKVAFHGAKLDVNVLEGKTI